MNMREITARKAALKTEMLGLHAAMTNGATDEQRAKFAALTAEAEGLTDTQHRIETIESMERSAPADRHFEAAAASVTVIDVIRAQMGETDAGAGRAREMSAEIARRSGRKPDGLFFHMGTPRTEQRIFSTTTPAGGPGSNIVPTVISQTMIDRLRERPMVRQMGASVITGAVGNLVLPRLKASTTGFWVPESGAITVSDPQVEQVLFAPKHAGVLTEISRQLVQQSSPDAAAIVEDDMAKVLAGMLDRAAIRGGGTNEPAGLLAAGSGITIVAGGTNGLAPSWANIVALISAVDTSNALQGTLGFLTNSKVTKAMRTTLVTTGDTSSNFLLPGPDMLAGYKLGVTNNVPSDVTKGSGTNLSSLIFGDWSQLVLCFWSELDILLNPYESTAYARGGLMIRAMMTVDIKIKQPLAFAAITDLIAP